LSRLNRNHRKMKQIPQKNPVEPFRLMLQKAESCINAGQLDAAVSIYRELLFNRPDASDLHHTLGLVYMELGQLDRAISHIGRSIQLNPHYANAYRSLGDAHLNAGHADLSLEAYRKALSLNPEDPDTLLNFGNALHQLDMFQDALSAYRAVVDRAPGNLKVLNNIAKTFQDMGQLNQALECYNRCLAIDPGYAEARFNRATALLALGQYSSGWQEYEWRFRRRGAHKVYPHRLSTPRWQGDSYTGRRLLVHCEQGMGDVIQFARYLPKVKDLGGTLILEVHAPLLPLLETMECVDEAVAFDVRRPPAINHDIHIPLLSLPRLFTASVEAIAKTIPYLHSDAVHTIRWRNKMNRDGFKIGLVWATSGTNPKRDCPLEECFSWFKTPGLDFFSLQVGLAESQLAESESTSDITKIGHQIEDFKDTAAVVANLDLIICVDTAVAHLAGAMGKPVWVLLPFTADWRWPNHCSTMRWYPTAKIFRQDQPGNWQHVMDRITRALAHLHNGNFTESVLVNHAMNHNLTTYAKCQQKGRRGGIRKRLVPGKPEVSGLRGIKKLHVQTISQKHRTSCQIKKVLLISPIYGGSLEVIRYLHSGFAAAGISAALQDNSGFYPVYRKIDRGDDDCKCKNHMVGRLIRTIDQRLMSSIEQYKPDLVIAIAQSPIHKDTVAKLRSKGIASAYWFVEDYRFRPYYTEVAPDFDFFFTIQRNEELKRQFEAMDKTKWHYLPLACTPAVHRPWKSIYQERRPYKCQLGFMGAPYLNRLNVFEQLAHWDLGIWGEGWNDCELSPKLKACVRQGKDRISVQESVKIYSCADIIVNLHSSPYVKGVGPDGDFVNPRTFEVAGCAGFQLSDNRKELPSLFCPGKEVICFDSIDELQGLIKYWLPRPDARKKIALQAQRRAYSKHTYRHRAKEIIGLLEN
jgi:spore maturation protein CgeB/Tfp pilus assembly protein PilF